MARVDAAEPPGSLVVRAEEDINWAVGSRGTHWGMSSPTLEEVVRARLFVVEIAATTVLGAIAGWREGNFCASGSAISFTFVADFIR